MSNRQFSTKVNKPNLEELKTISQKFDDNMKKIEEFHSFLMGRDNK